jgi:hypothetical protein
MSTTQTIACYADRLRAATCRMLPRSFGRSRAVRALARLPKLIAEAERCRIALAAFGQESDEEFTALAQGLAQINQRLKVTRDEADRLDRILQDRDEDRALASARTLYKSSVDLVHSSVGIAVTEQEQLGQIDEKLLAACRARDKFKRNDLLLRILTMSFRMEAARVDAESQAVFFNVAADIESIGQKIGTTTETAFSRIETVIAEARAERGDLKMLERDLQGRAQQSIQHIEQELAGLASALAPCIEHSRAIAGLFASTGPETLQIITALQHQDIVRQQLEHVAAGFHDLCEHFHETGPARTNRKRRAQVELAYVHRATCVQQMHLGSARQEIEQAGTDVVAGLNALLGTGATLVERLAEMENTAASTIRDNHTVRNFKEQISQLAQVATKSKEANDNITRLVQRIEEVVRMFSEEIVQHEFDVMLVALNAQIAAARLPSADALSKLAEETSYVSTDNTAVTDELTANLQACLVQLHQIKSEADEFLGIVTREKNELESGMIAVSEKLDRMLEHVHTGTVQARQDFAAVHDDCRALLERLVFPASIAQCFGHAEQLCTELLEVSADGAADGSLSTAAASRLQAHRDRYTMEKEDAAHAAALDGPTAAPTAAECFFADAPVNSTARHRTIERATPPDRTAAADASQPPAPPPDKTDLGDGIELF